MVNISVYSHLCSLNNDIERQKGNNKTPSRYMYVLKVIVLGIGDN